MEEIFIHETAIVESGVSIGAGSKLWHHCQVRSGAVIGRNVNIGKGVYVDVDVVIGSNVRIQNGVSLYKGVTIEDDVFIGPHCNFTNDLFPRVNSKNWQIIPTLIRKGASIGSNATIICGVTVGPYSMVSVGAVVSEDTLPFSLMVGHPARLKGFVCKCGQKMIKTENSGEYRIRMRCITCDQLLSIRFDEG
jgi:acetyltransferase-like isoleucine patch superfamily enzyme